MKQLKTPRKILIVRNDKLGDFVLSLPAFALIKAALPDCELHALVPQYTHDIAAACPWIDGVLLDPGKGAGKYGYEQLVSRIKQTRFDAVITLFSTGRIGLALYRAGIAERFAPATKLALVFYNRRLAQRRSRSDKPEYVYNLDLAKYCLTYFNVPLPEDPQPPFLQFNPVEILALRAEFCNQYAINPAEKLLFLHPGSGGSAANLTPTQYAALADALVSPQGLTVIITAGPGEFENARAVHQLMQKVPSVVYESTHGLLHFAKQIAWADAFISGSTGPLHIAGALDVPTAGFYTNRRSATSLRWRTLNSDTKRLAFSPPATADECDMSAIDISPAAAEISRKFL